MNTFFQFGVICAVAFVGQVINRVVPLPIPGNVYGLVIMFLLLWSGALKLRHVERAADMLIVVLPVIFVPAAMAIVDDLGLLWQNLIAVLLCCVLGTMVSIFISGHVTQAIRRKTGQYRPEDRRPSENDK